MRLLFFFFFKQKTAYEMRISDWSSDVCSSDLAYPAGELKHGPLALVDADMPVVVIAPNDNLLEKVKSNMQEVRARGGELFVFTDADSNFSESEGVHVIRTPRHVGVLSPIVHTIPVQLLAYHVALARGTDVDKPRNLAKSVTVE